MIIGVVILGHILLSVYSTFCRPVISCFHVMLFFVNICCISKVKVCLKSMVDYFSFDLFCFVFNCEIP